MPDNDHPPSLSTPGLILPEFHYDLVARLMPGAILLVVGGALVQAPALLLAIDSLLGIRWPTLAATTAIFFCAAYVLGMMLTWPQRWIRSLYFCHVWVPVLKRHRRLISARWADISTEPLPSEFETIHDTPKAQIRQVVNRLGPQIYEPLHDFLKRRNPQAQYVLTKMNAETGLFDQLTIGLLALSILIVLRAFLVASPVPLLTLLSLLCVALYCFFLARSRYDALIRRHFAYWGSLNDSENAVGPHRATVPPP